MRKHGNTNTDTQEPQDRQTDNTDTVQAVQADRKTHRRTHSISLLLTVSILIFLKIRVTCTYRSTNTSTDLMPSWRAHAWKTLARHTSRALMAMHGHTYLCHAYMFHCKHARGIAIFVTIYRPYPSIEIDARPTKKCMFLHLRHGSIVSQGVPTESPGKTRNNNLFSLQFFF